MQMDDYGWDNEPSEEYLKTLPVCEQCGDYIQGEYVWVIDEKNYCERCLKEDFKMSVEDWIEMQKANYYNY